METTTVMTSFAGLDRRGKAAANTFYTTENLSLRRAPLLSTRPLRQNCGDYPGVLGMLRHHVLLDGAVRDALCLISRDRIRCLYFEGNTLKEQSAAAEFTADEKQLVSMGAYIIVWPDRKLIRMEAPLVTEELNIENALTTTFELMPCNEKGRYVFANLTGPTEPDAPTDGYVWCDTSTGTCDWKKYDAESGLWLDYNDSVFVRLDSTDGEKNAAAGLRANDVIALEGLSLLDSTNTLARMTSSVPTDAEFTELHALEGTHTVLGTDGAARLWFAGRIRRRYVITLTTGTVTVSRRVPQMDYVLESGNRLWGCFYGLQNGAVINELYCCRLGDPFNWNVFEGISTDSWTASCGTDGPWTGCIGYGGYPLFFKEESLTKIYPSSIGAHRTVVTRLPGAALSGSRSLTLCGGSVVYHNRQGIFAYDGSASPALLSEALGEDRFTEVTAASFGQELLLSARSDSGTALYRHAADKGLWIREDDLDVLAFGELEGRIFALTRTGTLWCLEGDGIDNAVTETGLTWALETGALYYERSLKTPAAPEACRSFGFRFRIDAAEGTDMVLSAAFDGGAFEEAGRLTGTGRGIFLCPVTLKRSGTYRLRLEGSGEMTLYTLALTTAAEQEGKR